MAKDRVITGPSHTQGGFADFNLATDILRKNAGKYDTFIREWGEEYTLMDLLESLGWSGSKGYSNPYIEWGINLEDTRSFKIGAIITAQTGAGGDMVVAIDATDMKTNVGDDGLTRRSSRPRATEQIMFADNSKWKIKSKNSNVNPHQLTLEPALKTQLAAGVTVGKFAQIIAPTAPEATGQPKGLVPDFESMYNRFAIAKETNLVSGTNQTTSGIWEEIPGMPGKYYLKGLEEAEMRHRKNTSRLLVHAELADNWETFSPDFDTDVAERNTEGFLQSASYGKQGTYDDAAGYDLEDFKRANAFYRSKRLNAADIMVLQGGTIAGYTQDALLELFKAFGNSGILAQKYFGTRYGVGERFSADQMFLAIGFKGLQLNNFNYIFRDFTELNFPSEQGFTLDKNQYFIPMAKTKDAKNNKINLPAMQLCHREYDGYSRLNEVWKTGSAPSRMVNTDEWDVNRCFFRSEVALRTTAAGMIYVQKPGLVDA